MGTQSSTPYKADPLMSPGADGMYFKSPTGRYEQKYFISSSAVGEIVSKIKPWCEWDRGVTGSQEIVSLYYDSPDLKFFWDREESVAYRRKVRLRFYRTADEITYTTFEIKEKHKHLVVKKRVSLPSDLINHCRRHDFKMDTVLSFIPETAVSREIAYLHRSFNLIPTAWIHYDRVSFVGIHDRALRLTVDSNIRGLSPFVFPEKNTTQSIDLFGENRGIFEVKTSCSVPLWVSTLARGFELSQSRASKYCAAVKKLRS